MSGEIQRKIASKYDLTLEQEARLWMEAVLGEPLLDGEDPNTPLGMDKFHTALKDGVKLCKLLNAINPGSIRKVNTNSRMAFVQMENTGNFLESCVKFGVKKEDLFQTADLFDKTNMVAVLNGIYALGRKAQTAGFNGPSLGARESTANKRNFDEQTMNAGQTLIGLQMGSNKGASQAGMTFGRSRSINEHGVTLNKQPSFNGATNGGTNGGTNGH